MKFLVLVKATKDSEAGKRPEENLIMETMKLNEEMMKAGVALPAGQERCWRRRMRADDYWRPRERAVARIAPRAG